MASDDGAECLVNCCCCLCAVCTQACIDTDCCGACHSGTGCLIATALSAVALAALVALLVVAYAVVVPVRVTVEEATLGRLALTANNTALAYDVSLAVALRNRNFAVGVRRVAPLDAELRFRGQTFARVRLTGAEQGRIAALGKEVYRVAAMADRSTPVALGGDGVAEFARERDAGVFELELAVVGEVKYEGHRHRRGVRATCPLKLALSTATAPAAFTRVKCT
ncbi:unnamed protein product [Urochloa decumbens]|uniref:Late embryogenesis abundant protein LEA-2 subgroup domain-containing protein n=1 Tax=Urochloa decumbens TaxID=240449 RepID=A0ABC9DCA3_9POAL